MDARAYQGLDTSMMLQTHTRGRSVAIEQTRPASTATAVSSVRYTLQVGYSDSGDPGARTQPRRQKDKQARKHTYCHCRQRQASSLPATSADHTLLRYDLCTSVRQGKKHLMRVSHCLITLSRRSCIPCNTQAQTDTQRKRIEQQQTSAGNPRCQLVTYLSGSQ